MNLTATLNRAENGLKFAMPTAVAAMALRFALAVPFFKSGLTKWESFGQLSAGARMLFRDEFRLHVLGTTYPYPWPEVTAHLAATAEIVLPILLVLGLGTRLAAAALLLMTAAIQLTIPDGWANFHLPWAAMAAAIMVMGPGKISLDSVLRKQL